MSANSADFLAYVEEQLATLPTLRSGRFFGGTALRADGVQFAMIVSNTVFFVVDNDTRPHYERLGSRCFSYTTKKGRVEVKRYYSVPEALLDDPEALLPLARAALASAQRAAARRRR